MFTKHEYFSIPESMGCSKTEGGRNERENFCIYNLASTLIPIENSFGRLKTRYNCFQRAMDVKHDILSQVICFCLLLQNYCNNEKEKLPG